MSRENVEVVRASIAAWNRDDLSDWLQKFAPDAEWVPYLAVLEGSLYRGHADLERLWHDIRADLALKVVIEDLKPIPGGLLARLKLRSTAKGSGAQLEQPLTQVILLRDGLITRIEGYADEREALEAAGLRE